MTVSHSGSVIAEVILSRFRNEAPDQEHMEAECVASSRCPHACTSVKAHMALPKGKKKALPKTRPMASLNPEPAPPVASRTAVAQAAAGRTAQLPSVSSKEFPRVPASKAGGDSKPVVHHAKTLYDFAGQADGDLSFSAGDLLVITDSAKTWWRGHRAASPTKTSGIFPSNYVETVAAEANHQEVAITPPPPAATAAAALRLEPLVLEGSQTPTFALPSVPASKAGGGSKPVAAAAAAHHAKALYPFAAQTDGDLAFAEGDLLVITDATESWWRGYRAASPTKTSGVFPSNYVETVAAEAKQQAARTAAPAAEEEKVAGSNSLVLELEPFASELDVLDAAVPLDEVDTAAEALKQAKALYDFKAQRDGDLAFSVGDVIVITDAAETWWTGHRVATPSISGVFPSNYVEELVVTAVSTGVVPWVRIAKAETRSAAADSLGGCSSAMSSVRSRTTSFRTSSFRKDLSMRPEAWFCLKFAVPQAGDSSADHAPSSECVEVWRSFSQITAMQQELAREFAGYSATAVLRASTPAMNCVPAQSSKMVSDFLNGLCAHRILLHSRPVQAFLHEDFVSFDAAAESAVGSAESATDVVVDELLECQRRRSHLELFSAAALLATDPPEWSGPDGASAPGLREEIEEGWRWASDSWQADLSGMQSDEDGWSYAFTLTADAESWVADETQGSCLVRRRWHSRLRYRAAFQFDQGTLSEVVGAHRNSRRLKYEGGGLLCKLERRLATATADVRADTLKLHTPVRSLANMGDQTPMSFKISPPSVETLTPDHLSVVFSHFQFTKDDIEAVVLEFDGDPIMAAKRLSEMVEDPADGDIALSRLGLSSMVQAKQQVAIQEAEKDMDSAWYLRQCFEHTTDGVNAKDLQMMDSPGSGLFQETLTNSDLEAVYIACLSCVVGGSVHGDLSSVPKELTANDCKVIRDAVLAADLAHGLLPWERAAEGGASTASSTFFRSAQPPPSPTPRARKHMSDTESETLEQHRKLLMQVSLSPSFGPRHFCFLSRRFDVADSCRLPS